MTRTLAAFAVTLALAGCAAPPIDMAPELQDTAVKAFKAPPNNASAIYIYRNESYGASARMEVSIDGRPVGEMVGHTYLYREVSPGKHTIFTQAPESNTSIEVEVRPGQLAYVWQEAKMGWLSARVKLSQVDEETGKKGVTESKLAVSH